METKQTAVEWLVEEMIFRLAIRIENVIDGVKLLEEAKAMEKKQIMDAWKDSNFHRYVEEVLEYSAEEYYNETYGK